MHSGLKGKNEILKDKDSSGKDIKNLTLSTAGDCKKACDLNDACLSFTYIDGYRSCWLKKGEAKLHSKVFHCMNK